MTIGKAIYTLLVTDGTISAAVGNRIYPDMAAQQATFPFIVYQVIGNVPTDTKDGTSKLDSVRVQIDTYANTYTSAQDISDRVRVVCDRHTGETSGVMIDSIRYDNEMNLGPDMDQHVFGVSQEYVIRTKRT